MNSVGRALESIPGVEFRVDEPLARHIAFRVGGPVRLLARPRGERALFALLKPVRKLDTPFEAGLKGHRIRDARGSRKHANWIVNRGNPAARDIIQLIGKIENEIYGTFGVRLEREIRILDQLSRNPAR